VSSLKSLAELARWKTACLHLIDNTFGEDNVYHENLLVGLNNNGRTSEILAIPFNAEQKPCLFSLIGVDNSHDITPYKDTFLVTCSPKGFVYSVRDKQPIIHTETGRWIRGITIAPEGIWIGSSEIATRNGRHGSDRHGEILLFSHDTYEFLDIVEIPSSGQVQDLIYVKDMNEG